MIPLITDEEPEPVILYVLKKNDLVEILEDHSEAETAWQEHLQKFAGDGEDLQMPQSDIGELSDQVGRLTKTQAEQSEKLDRIMKVLEGMAKSR